MIECMPLVVGLPGPELEPEQFRVLGNGRAHADLGFEGVRSGQ